jgi:hypothetical protein
VIFFLILFHILLSLFLFFFSLFFLNSSHSSSLFYFYILMYVCLIKYINYYSVCSHYKTSFAGCSSFISVEVGKVKYRNTETLQEFSLGDENDVGSNLQTSFNGFNGCEYALADVCFYVYYTPEGSISKVDAHALYLYIYISQHTYTLSLSLSSSSSSSSFFALSRTLRDLPSLFITASFWDVYVHD